MSSPAAPRFAFGTNWRRFLATIDEERITYAESRLRQCLDCASLAGKRFLDIGSGSGLSSLAARRLGASVLSFDFDPESVACTRELKSRYRPGDEDWRIKPGDILDGAYLEQLGQFDIVYAWGVLHHTGELWRALNNAADRVAPSGALYVAIYNHQLYWTPIYSRIKRAYVVSPLPGKVLIAGAYIALQVSKGLIKDLLLLRNPAARYRARKEERGMSVWYDWIDWVGGYPFETAKPEEVFDFCRRRGFTLTSLVTCGGGHGCNEFVFRRYGGSEPCPGD